MVTLDMYKAGNTKKPLDRKEGKDARINESYQTKLGFCAESCQ